MTDADLYRFMTLFRQAQAHAKTAKGYDEGLWKDMRDVLNGAKDGGLYLWLLTFVDEKPMRSCVLQGKTVQEAIMYSWRFGCNPGGKVIGCKIPVATEGKFRDAMHKLRTSDEWHTVVGDAMIFPDAMITKSENEP